MPLCKCQQDYATVELRGPAGRVLVCEACSRMLEMVEQLFGVPLQRRPVLALVPRGSVE